MPIIEGKSYDVIVCGCGSAGFCAAMQSARLQKRTAVVEKYAAPGGTLTVLGGTVKIYAQNCLQAPAE